MRKCKRHHKTDCQCKQGGLATYERYGSEYMAKIGREGARQFYLRYSISPTGIGDYAIRRKADNVVIAFLSGRFNERHPAE